jgi:hypothetical protein
MIAFLWKILSSLQHENNFDLKREQIGKSGISVPRLIAASPAQQ